MKGGVIMNNRAAERNKYKYKGGDRRIMSDEKRQERQEREGD